MDTFGIAEPAQTLIKTRDEVFRKIGRNIVNFQKIEQLLKAIILCSRTSGYVSELEHYHAKKAEKIKNLTMGTLVKRFLDDTYSDGNNPSAGTEDIKEPYFSFSLNIKTDPTFLDDKIKSLKSLVEERNHLVHQLLAQYDLNSIESCLEINAYLDAQRERQKQEHEHLSALLKHMQNGWAELSAYYSSEDGEKAFELACLRQSAVIAMLFDLTSSLADPDGWVSLDNAARQIHSILPDEIERFKKSYKFKTLKDGLIAAELFDLKTEPTKSGVRVLYRVNPEIVFDND